MIAVGADFWACSAYKFCGPHLGATTADPALLETLRPDKLLPSADTVPHRFETGTPPMETLAGLAAAVDHLAALGAGVDRRAALLDAFATIEAYEGGLLHRLLDGLEQLPVQVLSRPVRRTPTVALIADGSTPQQLAAYLGAHGVAAWAGDYYAAELFRALELPDGALRLGLVHYNDASDVDTALEVLAAALTPSPLHPR